MNIYHFLSKAALVGLSLGMESHAQPNINEPNAFVSRIQFFDLPQNQLSTTLVDFALQSQINVAVEKDVIVDIRSTPVIGSMTPEQALYQLLYRTPFTYKYNQEDALIFIVERPIQPEQRNEEPQIAERENDTEELIVTGIRASLQRSLDRKFLAQEIVEVITEEDIGKFPDTNLAESLQRLSGVTISYSNNEGNKVSVRGFDPDFNLVTLNGRQMPIADLKQGLAAGTRSFNFTDLASENISAVEIYKTNSAELPSGGIGSVINVVTPRPLDYDRTRFTFSVKGTADLSNEEGSSVTPDLSFLYSANNNENTMGFLFSGSYSRRDSRSEAVEAQWLKIIPVVFTDGITPDTYDADAQNWYMADINFIVTDHERERINAQGVFQAAPSSIFTFTADVNYSLFDYEATSREFFVDPVGRMPGATAVFDENHTLITGESEVTLYKVTGRESNKRTENVSIGTNFKVEPSDKLSLEIDMHHSTSELSPKGGFNEARLDLRGFNMEVVNFNIDAEIPSLSFRFRDTFDDTNRANPMPADFIRGNEGFAEWSSLDATVDQVTAKLLWTNEESFLREFLIGGEVIKNEHVARTAEFLFLDPNAGTPSVDGYDFSVIQQGSSRDFFDQLDGGLPNDFPFYFYDLSDATAAIYDRLGDRDINNMNPYLGDYVLTQWFPFQGPIDNPRYINTISETNQILFMRANWTGELLGASLELETGVRYEDLEIEAESEFAEPVSLRQRFSTAPSIIYDDQKATTSTISQYSELFPSATLRVDFTDALVLRYAYSENITRPDMSLINAQYELNIPSSVNFFAFTGNVSLAPYSAINNDVSLEYYFRENSYFSAGVFTKKIDGFPIQTSTESSLYDLRDPFGGPRAAIAEEQVIARGEEPTRENVFAQMQANDPQSLDSGFVSEAEDPLATWTVFSPANADEVELEGWELAFQHVFANTGFGIVFNFTHVESDATFAVANSDYEVAFPVSNDFFNLVGFYENDHIQTRLAYHWNDTFPQLINGISGVVPVYTESYGQFDFGITYLFADKWSFFIEGINITDETQRTYVEEENRLDSASQFGPRYQAGFRFNL